MDKPLRRSDSRESLTILPSVRSRDRLAVEDQDRCAASPTKSVKLTAETLVVNSPIQTLVVTSAAAITVGFALGRIFK